MATLSYHDLDERASWLAAALVAHGVTPGDRVAIAVANRAEHIETLLASFKAGAVPVNLNRQYVGSELVGLFSEAQPALVVGDADLTELLCSVSGARPGDLRSATSTSGSCRATAPLPRPAMRSEDDEYLIFTSGSTGQAKGVRWTHRNLFFAALSGGNLGGQPIAAPEELLTRVAVRPARTLAGLAAHPRHGAMGCADRAVGRPYAAADR